MKFVIRPYEEKDLEAVLSAWENASNVGHPFLTEEFMAQERINIAEIYMPRADTWVIEHDQQVIGHMSLLGNEVGGLFVQPTFHGKGAGKALLDKAQALHGELELEVFKKNMVGRRFYKKYGFKLISESLHEETGNVSLRMKFTPKNEFNN